MDRFGFFSCMQFFIILGVCLVIVYWDKIVALLDRIAAWVARRRVNKTAAKLEAVGLSVVPAPAMSAEEVIRVMKEY